MNFRVFMRLFSIDTIIQKFVLFS